MTISIIAATSNNGIIGKNNSLPFDRPEDMRFFRKMTSSKNGLESVVIMGRKTFESIGSKPLPKRHNIVITQSKIEGIETYPTIQMAMAEGTGLEECDVWLIGGSNIYREGMRMAEHIYLTLMPDIIEGDDLAYFPWINPKDFQISEYIPLVNENLRPEEYLQVAHYVRQ